MREKGKDANFTGAQIKISCHLFICLHSVLQPLFPLFSLLAHSCQKDDGIYPFVTLLYFYYLPLAYKSGDRGDSGTIKSQPAIIAAVTVQQLPWERTDILWEMFKAPPAVRLPVRRQDRLQCCRKWKICHIVSKLCSGCTPFPPITLFVVQSDPVLTFARAGYPRELVSVKTQNNICDFTVGPFTLESGDFQVNFFRKLQTFIFIFCTILKKKT